MAVPDEFNSEWLTRKRRIDPVLDHLGWTKTPHPTQLPFRLEEFETTNGPADYALGYDSKVVAVVEAKKLTLGPQNVLTQAERYSKGASLSAFDFDGYRVPFLYSTNGQVIWFRDARHSLNRSHPVTTFHTPAALSEFLARDFDGAVRELKHLPNIHPRLRPYQIEANTAVETAIAQRKREMLLAMATGTGKTFTMVNQVYRLMKSKVAKRILFLVDRRALAAQAVRQFRSFEPEPGLKFDQTYELYSQRFQAQDFDEDEKFDVTVLPQRYLTEPGAGDAFVYVCTIQRMAMNLLGRNAAGAFGAEADDESDADKLDIPIHAFDLVIADECHRGYTAGAVSVWRDTLNHFDAIKIGLTATPASHTLGYFKEIVYRYDYERAVREGFFVDYDVIKLTSDVRLKGVFLKEGERITVVDPKSGAEKLDQLEDERQFEPAEIERAVTSPDSNRKIIEEFKKYALDHEQRYGRFPKTLIFAANDLPHTSHADQLVRLCRDAFGRGDGFVSKITGRVDRPLQRIREFRNRPDPGICVSVDLMSTGVDIPDLEFIIFLRSIQSRILFEQMLGRGTRKGEKYPDKSHFTVIDCFGGSLLERFRQSTGITAEEPVEPARSIIEIIDDIWKNVDRQYNIRCLVRRLQRIDKEMDRAKACPLFAGFGIADGDVGKYAQSLPGELKRNFGDAMKLLLNKEFQDLLLNYPRPPRRFFIADESQDAVTSQWMIRDGSGQELKPQDYLAAFSQFVKDNPAHIEAISILLQRPRDWSTVALKELRLKLSQTPQRFSEDLLQKAHAVGYRKALVDIISMVKHAAEEKEPLLTAQERVDRAIAKLTAGKTFTADQQKWLDRIRQHLVVNLTIEREDFDYLPIFADFGGWARADKDFDGRLMPLVLEINAAVAAEELSNMASVREEVDQQVTALTSGGITAEIAEQLRARVLDVCRRGGEGDPLANDNSVRERGTAWFASAVQHFSKYRWFLPAKNLLIELWDAYGEMQRAAKTHVDRAGVSQLLTEVTYLGLEQRGESFRWALLTQAGGVFGTSGEHSRHWLVGMFGLSDAEREQVRLVAEQCKTEADRSGWGQPSGFVEEVISRLIQNNEIGRSMLQRHFATDEFHLTPAFLGALLENVNAATSASEKGKTLEDTAFYLFSLMVGCVPRRNVLDEAAASEYDLVVNNLAPAAGLEESLFGRDFLVECKNWEKPIGVQEVGYFLFRMALTHGRFGVILSRHGITSASEGEKYATSLMRRAFHEHGSACIVLNMTDLEKLAAGKFPSLTGLMIERLNTFRFGK